MSFSIQKVFAQLKPLRFGRERALSVRPLGEFLVHKTFCSKYSLTFSEVHTPPLTLIWWEAVFCFYCMLPKKIFCSPSVLISRYKNKNPNEKTIPRGGRGGGGDRRVLPQINQLKKVLVFNKAPKPLNNFFAQMVEASEVVRPLSHYILTVDFPLQSSV